MSIELYCKCNDCRTEFYSSGEAVYCSVCYDTLLDEIDKLENRIKELERELEGGSK